MRTNYTQGGVFVFKLDKYTGTTSKMESDVCSVREGFCGWMGFGGSILQV